MILVLFVSCLNISFVASYINCFCVFAEFHLYVGLFKCFGLSVLFLPFLFLLLFGIGFAFLTYGLQGNH